VTDEPVPVAPPRVVSLYNPANILTVVRIVLVPVFLVLVIVSGMTSVAWRITACLAFCVASATDFADGWIARRFQLVTSFGKVADPIADKALIGTALVGLSILGELPWWVTVVVLVREIGVTLLRFWVIRHGIIPASRGGKVKAFLQAFAIGLYVLPLSGWLDSGREVLMGVAVVVTVITGIDYVARALTLRQTSERAAMKRARRAASSRD
jgi:CDP-diacylglycerol--glycerol-3-phosphate 3-phosphatidyltransferase